MSWHMELMVACAIGAAAGLFFAAVGRGERRRRERDGRAWWHDDEGERELEDDDGWGAW